MFWDDENRWEHCPYAFRIPDTLRIPVPRPQYPKQVQICGPQVRSDVDSNRLCRERESSVFTTYWSESTLSSKLFGGPASRHGSLNSLFQVENRWTSTCRNQPHTLYPIPHTLHLTPYTQNPIPDTLHRRYTGVFSIHNLLVRIRFVVKIIWWTGLAPWEFEIPFPDRLTPTFLLLPCYA